ncbi:MAG: Cof-type HAD-IIB family hydrolase [Prevotellaceae bacterium]|jgi:Cof subfamily protein (haloacid dehalogenase superfamily)|nr:Cof-type HAD-IIB family hydrolase [Prevotellaceae bacterium]
MNYEILVLDVGETLLNSAHEITPHVRNTLIKVQQAGVKIVLASGRTTHNLLNIAHELEMDVYGGYVMSHNGAKILRADNGEVLFEKRILLNSIPFLYTQAKKNDFAVLTYHNEIIYTDSPDHERVQHEAALYKMNICYVADFMEDIDFEPCKIMLVSDHKNRLLEVEKPLRMRLNGVADVIRSEDSCLEIVAPSVNKGDSLNVLLDLLKIPVEKVLAIGEGVADIPMLQSAGFSIAMGNAPDSVRVCADNITSTNDEDGVAQAVEKYIVAEIRPNSISLATFNANTKNSLIANLGIQYTYASPTRIEATMPVDIRTRQPFGILHGGATLALAETVAGLGSMLICQPTEMIVGVQISGNHVSAAYEGDTVRAIATIIHKGSSLHVWNVDIFTSTDKLVSSVRVLNSVLQKRK